MSSMTTRVNGLSFRTRLDGKEGAPWLVFSNSLLTDLTLWDAQVGEFNNRYRILRYDQRGHGGTEVPAGPATLEELATDAEALMAHLDIEDATFIGVSMGAATGLLLATRAPGRVAAVLASDGQAGTAPGGAQAWQERIDMAAEEGMDAFADATLRRWFSPASIAAGNPAIARVREMILATPEAGFVACARALQSAPCRAACARWARRSQTPASSRSPMPATCPASSGRTRSTTRFVTSWRVEALGVVRLWT
jgi:3-oxoadipate enol-lactonase